MKKYVLVSFLVGALNATDELEFWWDTKVQGRVSDQTSISLHQQYASTDVFKDIYFYLLESAVILEPRKNFSVSPTLRTGFIKLGDGRWILEVTPYLALGYVVPMKSIELYSTVKFMYRVFQLLENRGVLRWKIGLKVPIKSRLKFLIQNEAMYNYAGFRKFDDNRTAIGYTVKLNDNISTTLFYMREEVKVATGRPWKGKNIFGISLAASF